MTKLKNKLHSQKGASILFAVIAMLVVVMVAAVILFAAQSNVTRAARNQKEQQAYLTVSSAANMVIQTMTEGMIYFPVDKQTPMTYTYDRETKELKGNPTTGTLVYQASANQTDYKYRKLGSAADEDNVIASAIADCIRSKLNNAAELSADTPRSFKIKVADSKANFEQTCRVDMTIDKDFNVVMEFGIDGAGKKDPNYNITLIFNYLSFGTDGNAYKLVEDMDNDTEPTYSAPVILDDEDENPNSIKETVTMTQKCKGYFTWNLANMEIQKGDKEEKEA